MKLIYSDSSPYARIVRIFVRELNLLDKVEEIIQHPFDNPPQLISFNPLCKVPCLISDDDLGIFDSQVICQYLDELSPLNLYKNINQDWQLKTCLSLTYGILDSCVAWQQDKMRGKEGCSEFWQKRFISSVERGLTWLQKKLLILPQDFSAIDINLITILEYLDFRHPNYNWQERHSGFIELYNFYKSRLSVVETVPKA